MGEDSSVKYLIEFEDGNTIETLYMFDKDNMLTYHSTVCVSSQVGCAIGCRFCATGKQGFVRNLSITEITDQVSICNTFCANHGIIPIDAVVFAGMGEPLLNYENVKKAILKINYCFGIRDFEVATAGIVPGIYSMIRDFKDTDIHIRLNISLHAPSDNKRKTLIPLTDKYGINEMMAAAVDYAKAFKTKARIRYMLVKGINDTDRDIAEIVNLLGNKPVKLVISLYNENNIQGLAVPDYNDLLVFRSKIGNNMDCEIFHNFGSGIHAGCGQLRQAKERMYTIQVSREK